MRAILSVSDKTRIDLLGRGLSVLGFEIYSTGGTQQVLQASGVPVRPVSDLTGYPEILNGRVKTLHPGVYGGILARRGVPADQKELLQHSLGPIDLVAVNLYPFQETVNRPDVAMADALEQIDIGGPAMLRAAAKNYPDVLPLCDPADYQTVLETLKRPEGADNSNRRALAAKAFRHTAVYDALVAGYLGADRDSWFDELPLGLKRVQGLRYGENPQQRAAVYSVLRPGSGDRGLTAAQQHQGKPLSYNNYLDADAAWAAVTDQEPVAVAIVKHTNPCGLAQADNPLDAYRWALAGDPEAAFGGIVAVNEPVDGALAHHIVERFYEIIMAPAFDAEALEILKERPNMRVLSLSPGQPENEPRLRSISGGMLVQEADSLHATEVEGGRVVTEVAPTREEWMTMLFAWRAVRHVRSNAIVLARAIDGETRDSLAIVGMGAGQPSRVAAVEIAIQKAGSLAGGSVLASDAFFPKADGLEAAARAGVQAVVQPGGSLGDKEVIEAANANGMSMVFTGTRHFLH